MGLFGDTEKQKNNSAKKAPVAKSKLSVKESGLAAKFLSHPRVTEKSYTLNALNQYVFVVNKMATKKVVKRSVEEVYAVNVEKVRIISLPAKKQVSGNQVKSHSAVKKAVVSIAEGQTLEILKSGI